MHVVNATIERPDPELMARAAACFRENIVEEIPRTQIMDPAIRPLGERDWTMIGPALTVKLEHLDHLMCLAAAEVAKPGDIVVIDAQGQMKNAVWGGGLTMSAKNAGIAGVVVDGACLDARSMLSQDMPIFTRGMFPVHGTWEKPGSINVPIACGGVVVEPGDIVWGDLDGVIVIPRKDLRKVVEGAEKRSAKIREVGGILRRDKTTLFALRDGRQLLRDAGVVWQD